MSVIKHSKAVCHLKFNRIKDFALFMKTFERESQKFLARFETSLAVNAIKYR
jgi:hypothetical protein